MFDIFNMASVILRKMGAIFASFGSMKNLNLAIYCFHHLRRHYDRHEAY